MKHLSLIVIVIIIASFSGFGQNLKPDIKVTIKGNSDSLLFLAKYYGDKTYLVDTALRKKNSFYLTPDSLYPQGLYMLVSQNKKRMMDLLMGSDQTFEISTDTSDYFNNCTIKGNEELKAFVDYFIEFGKKQEIKKNIIERSNLSKDNPDSLTNLRNELRTLDSIVKLNEENTINKYKGSFFSVFLKASQEIELPDSIAKSEATDRDKQAFRFMRAHFFDNISFTDERLLNTPFFYQKIETYLDKMIIPLPDSLIAAIDDIIGRTNKTGQVFKFLIWKLTIKYETSKIMGYDKIFVHLIDTYYISGLVNWYDAKVMEQLIGKGNTLKPLLIGKQAPPIILADTAGKYYDLYKIPAKYTILYFWDPDCGHCREELPKLKEYYAQKKDSLNLEIFSICVDPDLEKMKKYLKKNDIPWIKTSAFIGKTAGIAKTYDALTTPLIYILNENKTIIAKRLLSGQFDEFFKNQSKQFNIHSD